MPEKNAQTLADRATEIFSGLGASLRARGLVGPDAGTVKIDLIGGSVPEKTAAPRRSRVPDLTDTPVAELREMFDRADQTGYAGSVTAGALGKELNRRSGK